MNLVRELVPVEGLAQPFIRTQCRMLSEKLRLDERIDGAGLEDQLFSKGQENPLHAGNARIHQAPLDPGQPGRTGARAPRKARQRQAVRLPP